MENQSLPVTHDDSGVARNLNWGGALLSPSMEGLKVPSEARSAAAPRGVGSREGRRSPSPVWGLGLGAMPPEKLSKINVKIACIFAS